MTINCSVKDCKSRQVKGGRITFHKFPSDPVRRSQWIKSIGRENNIPGSSAKVCSKHFEAECFDREKFGGTWLKSTAVPTIFNFESSEDNSAVKKEPSPTEDTSPRRKTRGATLVPNAAVFSMDEESDGSDFEKQLLLDKPKGKARLLRKTLNSKRKRISYLGDFKDGESYTDEELRLGLNIANKLVKQQNRKMRCLRGINKRLRKRVEHLNDVLEEYKKKVYIPSDVLKEALAKSKKFKVKIEVNGSPTEMNESCDNSLPISPNDVV